MVFHFLLLKYVWEIIGIVVDLMAQIIVNTQIVIARGYRKYRNCWKLTE